MVKENLFKIIESAKKETPFNESKPIKHRIK